MNNVKTHKLLLVSAILSWIVFFFFLLVVYWNAICVIGLFISLLVACITTVMLSKFRSKNY